MLSPFYYLILLMLLAYKVHDSNGQHEVTEIVAGKGWPAYGIAQSERTAGSSRAGARGLSQKLAEESSELLAPPRKTVSPLHQSRSLSGVESRSPYPTRYNVPQSKRPSPTLAGSKRSDQRKDTSVGGNKPSRAFSAIKKDVDKEVSQQTYPYKPQKDIFRHPERNEYAHSYSSNNQNYEPIPQIKQYARNNGHLRSGIQSRYHPKDSANVYSNGPRYVSPAVTDNRKRQYSSPFNVESKVPDKDEDSTREAKTYKDNKRYTFSPHGKEQVSAEQGYGGYSGSPSGPTSSNYERRAPHSYQDEEPRSGVPTKKTFFDSGPEEDSEFYGYGDFDSSPYSDSDSDEFDGGEYEDSEEFNYRRKKSSQIPPNEYGPIGGKRSDAERTGDGRSSSKLCFRVNKDAETQSSRDSPPNSHLSCYTCVDGKTGEKFDECSYQPDPKPKQYSSRPKHVPSPRPYRSRRNVQETPVKNRDKRQYDYDSNEDDESYHRNYRFGPEYFENEESREDHKYEEDSENGEHCTKMRKKNSICIVCDNRVTGRSYEQCSYATSDPNMNAYAHSSQMVYGRNSDRPRRYTEEKTEEEEPEKENYSISAKNALNVRGNLKHNGHSRDPENINNDFRRGQPSKYLSPKRIEGPYETLNSPSPSDIENQRSASEFSSPHNYNGERDVSESEKLPRDKSLGHEPPSSSSIVSQDDYFIQNEGTRLVQRLSEPKRRPMTTISTPKANQIINKNPLDKAYGWKSKDYVKKGVPVRQPVNRSLNLDITPFSQSPENVTGEDIEKVTVVPNRFSYEPRNVDGARIVSNSSVASQKTNEASEAGNRRLDTENEDHKNQTPTYEEYFYKLFPELAQLKLEDYDYFSPNKDEVTDGEGDSTDVLDTYLPGFEYEGSLPKYFKIKSNKKNVAKKALENVAHRNWTNCKKVRKDKMSCFHCLDNEGIRHEECMLVASTEPKEEHLSTKVVKKHVIDHESDQNIPHNRTLEGNLEEIKKKKQVKSMKSQTHFSNPIVVDRKTNQRSGSEKLASGNFPMFIERQQMSSQSEEEQRRVKRGPADMGEGDGDEEDEDDKEDNNDEEDEEEQEPKKGKTYNPIPSEPPIAFGEYMGPEGAFSEDLEPVYDKFLGFTLPRYMLEKSEQEAIFDEAMASGYTE